MRHAARAPFTDVDVYGSFTLVVLRRSTAHDERLVVLTQELDRSGLCCWLSPRVQIAEEDRADHYLQRVREVERAHGVPRPGLRTVCSFIAGSQIQTLFLATSHGAASETLHRIVREHAMAPDVLREAVLTVEPADAALAAEITGAERGYALTVLKMGMRKREIRYSTSVVTTDRSLLEHRHPVSRDVTRDLRRRLRDSPSPDALTELDIALAMDQLEEHGCRVVDSGAETFVGYEVFPIGTLLPHRVFARVPTDTQYIN